LLNLALFWVKNVNFFAIFFCENIFKIITSVPACLIHSLARLYTSTLECHRQCHRHSVEMSLKPNTEQNAKDMLLFCTLIHILNNRKPILVHLTSPSKEYVPLIV
jgi:hypothetical protein